MRPALLTVYRYALLTAMVMSSGCASGRPGPETPVAAREGRVTGKVYYRARIAVPPGSVLTVRLDDVTDSGRPRTIARQVGPITAIPADFELRFEPRAIREGRVYQVHADLEMGGKSTWTHLTAYPVLTSNAPNYVEIVVGPVER